MFDAVGWTPKECPSDDCPSNEWQKATSKLEKARDGLKESHDKLSALLEDEDAGNDAIRDAAIEICDALNAFWEAT
jgi:cellobiose-specific phosphotransferase system component IIA